MIKWRRESILDIYNLILGASLFASPWPFAVTSGIVREDVWISSALIIVLSVATLIAFAEWEEWGILILGVWLAVSPWVLSFQNVTATKVNVGIGLFVAYLAAIELWLIHYSQLPPSKAS